MCCKSLATASSDVFHWNISSSSFASNEIDIAKSFSL